jgi:hypothetical protein
VLYAAAADPQRIVRNGPQVRRGACAKLHVARSMARARRSTNNRQGVCVIREPSALV